MTPDYSVSMPGGFTANQNGHCLPPVYLLVEILSRDQGMLAMERKGRRYLEWGVLHVWLIDPMKQKAVTLRQGGGRQDIRANGSLDAGPGFAVLFADVLAS